MDISVLSSLDNACSSTACTMLFPQFTFSHSMLSSLSPYGFLLALNHLFIGFQLAVSLSRPTYYARVRLRKMRAAEWHDWMQQSLLGASLA